MKKIQTPKVTPARTGLCFGFCLLAMLAARQSVASPQWEATVAAARKEGQVNVYIGGWNAVLDAGVFQKRYPEIKLVGVTGRGGAVARRILTERRAGKYIADVSIEGFNSNYLRLHRLGKAFDPIKPALMLPEVLDTSKWWQGRHSYLDPEGKYVFRFAGIPQLGSVHYNTKFVNPKEIQSFWDFLEPRWKGKMEARDARTPGPGNGALRFFYHNPQLGPEFIRRLFGETDIGLFRDFRQGPDWLITGKYVICFFCSGITRAKEQGLPVDSFGLMKEGAGLVSQYGTVAYLNRAPHPKAAKVFINWFLSRDGQSTLQRSLMQAENDAPDSLRIDIDKDYIPEQSRRLEGVEYTDMDVLEKLEMRPIVKILNEVLAQTKGR